MSNRGKGIIYAILSSIAFGTMPIFAKIAYNNGSNAPTVLSARFLLAALILFVYFKVKNQNLKINKKQLYILSILGVFGYTITSQTLFLSYNYLSVGLATTIHFVYPAVVCVIGYLLFKERIDKTKLLALILSILGVFILVGFEEKSVSIVGILLALISGISYGVNIVGLGLKEVKFLDNKISTFYISIFAGITMLFFAIVTKQFSLAINIDIVMSYIGISVISTIISIVFLLKAIEKIGSTLAAILATLEPIVSIILGVVFFKEQINITIIIGTIIILTSVVIIAKSKEVNNLENIDEIEENI